MRSSGRGGAILARLISGPSEVALEGGSGGRAAGRRLCGACGHRIALHLHGCGSCCALACECGAWTDRGEPPVCDGEGGDDGAPATLASLRYAELPEGVAQLSTVD